MQQVGHELASAQMIAPMGHPRPQHAHPIVYATHTYAPHHYRPQARPAQQPQYLAQASSMLRIAISVEGHSAGDGGSDTDTMDGDSDCRADDCTPAQGANKPSPWNDGQPHPGAASRGRQRGQIKKQAWTPLEDQRLIELVGMHGPSCWSEIAKSLEGRVGKQC
eukprot:2083281-Pleurochrysis_carterae.AAC.1